MFNIENRRYVGNKHKLMNWIKTKVDKNCKDCNSFFDVFAGTGSVSSYFINDYNNFILNDFLYSNEMIYKGFFMNNEYNIDFLNNIKKEYNKIKAEDIPDNYMSKNFGGKFFEYNDAKKIGYIRQDIEDKKNEGKINGKEYAILLTSLIYSFDRISNTVGHYEAFIKGKEIRKGQFIFKLIKPLY